MKENYQKSYKEHVKTVGLKLDYAQPLGDDFGMNADQAEKVANWGGGFKVVYTSRTHSQLAQVMNELKYTDYRDTVKGVALGSRDQLCINEEVLKDATTSAEKIHLCRAKVKAKQCGYHSRVDKVLEQPEVTNETIMDIEDLVKIGKSCKACPYFMARKLSQQADAVFLPYNYILDAKLLKAFKLDMANSIVILDEGHNVEKVCQDAASVQLASSDIATCIEDITHIMKLLEENDDKRIVTIGEEDAPDFTIDDCAKLKEIMLAFEKQVDGIQEVTSKGRTLVGGKVFDYLSAVNITQETYEMVAKLIDTFLEFLQEAAAGKAFGRKGFGLAKMNEFLGVVYGGMTKDVSSWKQTVEKGYRLHVEIEEQKKKWGAAKSSDGWMNTSVQKTLNSNAKVLNYWCFNPGFGMANLISRNVHSIILTSGTLAPLKPLISELGLDVKQQLENPHVIKPSQVLARIISQGVDGTPLNCGFQNRDNPKYIHSLALTIKTVASVTPNGLLVFFPSYFLMNKAQEAWEQSGMWKAMNDVKPIFTEPKKKDEFDECMNDYYNAVSTSRGAIFMAVLRGKVSEGLDFKDQNGRAVIIVGLPFPPFMDARVVLKKEYLEHNRTRENQLVTGQEWYNTEATRAVNQAIGRVIRHKDDYGAILLCDQRFHNYKQGLSKWIRGFLPPPTNEKFIFGSVIKDLSQFFRNAASTLPVPAPVEIKRELSDENEYKLFDNRQSAKVKSEGILKQHIKIENSNEIYGNNSNLSAVDYKIMDKFIKKEEKPTSFLGGLSKDVSSLDFNAMGASTATSSSLKFAKPSNSEEYESASKKRKLKMAPNPPPPPKELTFDYVEERRTVKKEIYEKAVPEDRKEFLELVINLH